MWLTILLTFSLKLMLVMIARLIFLHLQAFLFLLFVDFSDLFDWNVKQLFVYVVAVFETKKHVSCFVIFHSLPPSPPLSLSCSLSMKLYYGIRLF